jgi:hypothetical protein
MTPLKFLQRLAALVPQVPDEPAQKERTPQDSEGALGGPMRLGREKLLKRVFNLDLEHCPNCGGELKVIAAILERPAIEKIPNHLALQARALPHAPARWRIALQDIQPKIRPDRLESNDLRARVGPNDVERAAPESRSFRQTVPKVTP